MVMSDLFVIEARIESERLVTYLPSFVIARKLLVPNSSTNVCVAGSRKSATAHPFSLACLLEIAEPDPKLTNRLVQFVGGVERFIQEKEEFNVIVEDSSTAIEIVQTENEQLKKVIFEIAEAIGDVFGEDLEDLSGEMKDEGPTDPVAKIQTVFIGIQQKKLKMAQELEELRASNKDLNETIDEAASLLSTDRKGIRMTIEQMVQDKKNSENEVCALREEVIQIKNLVGADDAQGEELTTYLKNLVQARSDLKQDEAENQQRPIIEALREIAQLAGEKLDEPEPEKCAEVIKSYLTNLHEKEMMIKQALSEIFDEECVEDTSARIISLISQFKSMQRELSEKTENETKLGQILTQILPNPTEAGPLEAQLLNIKDIISELKDQISANKSELVAKEQEIDRLNQDNTKLSSLLETNGTFEDVNLRIKELSVKEKQLDEALGTREHLDKISELLGNLELSTRQLQERDKSIQQLKDRVHGAEAAKDELERKNEQAEKQADVSSQVIETLKQELAELTSQTDKLKSTLDEQTRGAKAIEKARASLEGEVETLRKELQHSQSMVKRQEDETKEIAIEVEELKRAATLRESELHNSREQVARYEAEVLSLTAKISNLEDTVKEVDQLKNKIEKLKEQKHNLETQLASSNGVLDERMSDIEAQNLKVSKLLEELDNARAAKAKEIAELKTENQSLKETVDDKDVMLQRQSEKASHLATVNEKLHMQIGILKNVLQETQVTVSETNAALKDISKEAERSKVLKRALKDLEAKCQEKEQTISEILAVADPHLSQEEKIQYVVRAVKEHQELEPLFTQGDMVNRVKELLK